jgi:hypothetical protein
MLRFILIERIYLRKKTLSSARIYPIPSLEEFDSFSNVTLINPRSNEKLYEDKTSADGYSSEGIPIYNASRGGVHQRLTNIEQLTCAYGPAFGKLVKDDSGITKICVTCSCFKIYFIVVKV